MDPSAEAGALRQKAMPKIMEDLMRVPDHLVGGPDLPADEAVRARGCLGRIRKRGEGENGTARGVWSADEGRRADGNYGERREEQEEEKSGDEEKAAWAAGLAEVVRYRDGPSEKHEGVELVGDGQIAT